MTGTTAILRLTLAAICAVAIPVAAQETGDLDRLRQHALELVNDARSEAGLSTLSLGPVLNEAAQGHAADMADRDYYAHDTPDGRTPRDRFNAAGGSRWALSGENIAKCTGCTTPPDSARVEAFHEGWMQSPGHRENILSDGFDRFGFGIVGAADEVYAVQTFAGSGQVADTPALGAEEAGAVALDAINVRRQNDGLAPLEASEALAVAAERVLEARLAGEDLPENILSILPEGVTGWTSIAIRTGSRGGAGGALAKGAIVSFVEDWASGDTEATLGGERAAYLGFAAAALGDGRATAVAVFGGRD
ncbi:CAP domain-containing protein [Oceaniovalibus sp. ACAM 378]|uniref:CAP domain-containing protein n=1 Tax=Oceaniovalibus sp. ACAM 378 TaxID=2599923 RepID=UPI00165294CA|nr:CAP domain-containing protein [Oceaniovalibus sp. ACAM 378]